MVKKLSNPNLMESRSCHALAYRRTLADHPDFFATVENYLLLGATEEQIAEFFGTTRETWMVWRKRSSDLRNAIARGSHIADAEVAAAMKKRATGYDYIRPKVVIKDGHATVLDLVEHVPPDTAAGKFWLTNRTKHWSDKTEHNHGGNVEIDKTILIEFVGSTSEPLNITHEAETP